MSHDPPFSYLRCLDDCAQGYNQERSKCPYCKKEDGAVTDVFRVERLRLTDYSSLLQNGWNSDISTIQQCKTKSQNVSGPLHCCSCSRHRFGLHAAKPVIHRSCCPTYAIRCHALHLVLLRSQKKVLRHMNKFLANGSTEYGKYCDSTRISVGDRSVDSYEDKSAVVPQVNKRDPRVRTREPSRELESYFEQRPIDTDKHKLEYRYVPVLDKPGKKDYKQIYDIYRKYEKAVFHKNDSEVPSLADFCEVYATSPFSRDSENPLFGSYHLPYVLHGTVIGVDVLDILPDAIVSLYFFYEPQYSFLSLGTYSVLHNLYLVRKHHRTHPHMQYFSTVYYVPTSPKVQYMLKFRPSYLCLPHTRTWLPVSEAVVKLEAIRRQYRTDKCTGNQMGKETNLDQRTVSCGPHGVMSFGEYLKMLSTLVMSTGAACEEVSRTTYCYQLLGDCSENIALVRPDF